MPLTEKHRKQMIYAFCVVFYLLMFLKLWNGFLLYQLKPFLFNTRFDLLAWLLMKAGIHLWLLNNPFGWLVFDVAFYSMPALYVLAYLKSARLASGVAVVMLVVNYTYIQCYTLYPANSVESFIPWMLFPFLFMCVNVKSFYFLLHALRYFFLFFFVSAAIWKFVQAGIFSLDQMSGVLLFQHKELLVSSPNFWYTHFIYWLVSHPYVSYSLYFGATLLELSFLVGFFSKRFDRLLAAAFILFLLTDLFFMRIPYWEITPFLIPLLFSRYTMPSSHHPS